MNTSKLKKLGKNYHDLLPPKIVIYSDGSGQIIQEGFNGNIMDNTIFTFDNIKELKTFLNEVNE